MRWTDLRIVAFDTETTGLQPFEGDRIIEFGAVEFTVDASGRITGSKDHQMFVNPQRLIPRAASRVSGITDQDVARAPTFDKVCDAIRRILADSMVVAHNLAFDLGFLKTEMAGAGKSWPQTRAEVDTLALSQRIRGDLRSHRLEVLCKEYGVKLNNAHRASHDADACGRVMLEMAKRFDAPGPFEEFVSWADAVTPPPRTGHLRFGDSGTVEFDFGALRGESILHHPDVLHWMVLARERRDGSWRPKFPEALRAWVQRWLRARCAGRNTAPARSQTHLDWTLDPRPWVDAAR